MVKGFAKERLQLDTAQWINLEEIDSDAELHLAVKAAINAALEALRHSGSFTAADDMQARLGIFMANHAEIILGMLERGTSIEEPIVERT
jgi:hypothetical protein